MLAAPVASADALGRDRTRGALGLLLATDVSAAEIVLGTAAARLGPVLAPLMATIPVAVLAAAWFGTDPQAVLILGADLLGVAVLGGSAALGLSLWTKRTHEALLGVYGIWAAWLSSWDLWAAFSPPPAWLFKTHPYYLASAPLMAPGSVTIADALVFLGGTAALSSLILIAATIGLRAAVLREPWRRPVARLGSLGRARAAWRAWVERLPGPSLDGNPILWREWWHGRRSRWRKTFWAIYALGAITMTVLHIQAFWHGQIGRPALVQLIGFEVGLGLLAVAVASASSWAEERASGQGGLDLLLATPLSAATILGGKWWAAYRSVLLVALLPACPVIVLALGAPTMPHVPARLEPPVPVVALRGFDRIAVVSVVVGQVLLYGAVVVSLGLMLATRFKRPVRAVVVSVVVYGSVTIGWPILEEDLLMRRIDRYLSEGLAAVSPLAGPIVTLMSMFSPWFGTARGSCRMQRVGWLSR